MWKTFTSLIVTIGLVACGSAPTPPEMVDNSGESRGVSAPRTINPEVERQYQDALALIRSSNREAARRLLIDITEREPGLSGPWTNLGRIYSQEGQHDAARSAFEKAVAANPDNCAARSEYGVMLRKLGEFDAALAQYQACIAAQPDHAPTYYNLGILYELYLGNLPEALAAYRHYLELTPTPDKKVEGWVADLERRAGS
jgi:tetratricopeptide (TPR) repeat protein